MVADLPLLSSYKRGFVLRRLFHTLTGIKIAAGQPAYAVLIQVFLWSIHITYGLLISLLMAEPWIRALAGGLTGLAISGGFQTLAYFLRRDAHLRYEENLRPEPVLEEEDDHNSWDGVLGAITWSRIIPQKQWIVNNFIHPCILGAVMSLSCLTVSSELVKWCVGQQQSGWVALLVFAWTSINIGIQPLFTASVPETATFRHVDVFEISAFSRPFHIIVSEVIVIVSYFKFQESTSVLCLVVFIVVALFPALWLLGVLPGFEPCLLWLSEQILVFCCGGSKACSPGRLSANFLVAAVQLGGIYILAMPNQYATIVAAAISGFLLSTNWLGLGNVFSLLKEGVGINNGSVAPAQLTGEVIKKKKSSGENSSLQIAQLLTSHSVNLLVCILLAVLYTKKPHRSYRTEKAGEGLDDSTALGWSVLTYLLLTRVFYELRKVFVLFGSIRSPFYSSSEGLVSTAFSRMFSLIHPSLGSILCLTYCLSVINQDVVTFSRLGSYYSVSGWIELTCLVRILRWVWQSADSALLEMTIHHLLRMYTSWISSRPVSDLSVDQPIGGLAGNLSTNQSFVELTPENNSTEVSLVVPDKIVLPLLSSLNWLLLIGVFVDRMHQAIFKLYVVIALTITSLDERASRRPFSLVLFQLNLLLLPVLFGTVVVSSLLSCPVLPLFTLPLFMVAYPRYSRFWPGPPEESDSLSSDSVYYEQGAPKTMGAVAAAAAQGRLGVLEPEDMLLARYDAKIIWIQIHEKGNRYLALSAKGMELQETSCHSLEATRIDDMFEATFERRSLVNEFLFHSLTPVSELEVPLYSRSHSQLTEVLQDNETQVIVAKTFLEALVWLLINHAKRLYRTKPALVEATDIVIKIDSYSKDEGIGSNDEQSPPMNNSKRPDKSAGSTVQQLNIRNELDLNLSYNKTSPHNKLNSDEKKLASISSPHLFQRQNAAFSPDISDEEFDSDEYLNFDDYVNKQRRETYSSELPGLVDPAVAAGHHHHLVRRLQSNTQRTYLTPTRLIPELLPESRPYRLPGCWFDHLEDVISVPSDLEWFPREFYKYLLRNAEPDVLEDSVLLRSYRWILETVFHIVYGRGSSPSQAGQLGAKRVVAVFTDFPRCNLPADLAELAHSAYKFAVKIALDKVLVGDYSMTELDIYLQELSSTWFLGPAKSNRWKESVKSEVQNLFSLEMEIGSDSGLPAYKSLMLKLQKIKVRVGRLNKELVRSLWSSLSLELLYLTNDDDERYSIQAEERLLRNLTVQSADPPLGYAIYSSSATTYNI